MLGVSAPSVAARGGLAGCGDTGVTRIPWLSVPSLAGGEVLGCHSFGAPGQGVTVPPPAPHNDPTMTPQRSEPPGTPGQGQLGWHQPWQGERGAASLQAPAKPSPDICSRSQLPGSCPGHPKTHPQPPGVDPQAWQGHGCWRQGCSCRLARLLPA